MKESQEWARQAFMAGLKIGAGDAEDIVECNYMEHGESEISEHVTCKMMDVFRPAIEKRSIPVKKDSSERSVLEFNTDCCSARVWNHGFGGQCTKKHLEGGTLCKSHQNAKNKLPEGDDLKHGYYNEERPLFMLTAADGREKGDAIAWADLREKIKAERSSKKKAASSKKPVKKAPVKEVKFPRPKGRGPKGKIWDYEHGNWSDSNVSESPAVEKEETPDIAAGVGEIKEVVEVPPAEVAPVVEEVPPAEVVSVVKEIISATENDKSPDLEIDNGKESDLEIDNGEDDEKITYEGVEYIYDEEQKEVYTVEDMELMGTWNAENQTIIWEDEEEGPKIHEQLKNA